MNFNKFINSDYLKENPLCGIDTYKDELNLTTGECTRRIKKLVLTGQERWYSSSKYAGSMFAYLSQFPEIVARSPIYCSHLIGIDDILQYQRGTCIVDDISVNLWLFPGSTTPDTLKRYLAAQYANGTPVTVWYVLATPTTEVITVPSGLSGTVEGYLNQSDTPTPTNPIYPTANTVEQWVDLNYYIMGTSTDTITTLPAVLYPTGTTATVGLKGQAVQSGTPTPDSPIMPQGTGERTGNLCTPNLIRYEKAYNTQGIIDFPGGATYLLQIEANTTYTVKIHSDEPIGILRVGLYNEDTPINGTFVSSLQQKGSLPNPTITVENSNYKYLYVQITGAYIDQYGLSQVMINTGSTDLPYEPYGYKIPISSANTTTPVYLGEVETTRKIAKIDLGTMNWGKTVSGNFWAATAIPNIRTISNASTGNAICDMFKEVTPNNVGNEPYSFSSCLNTVGRPFINKTGFEDLTVEEFKQAMSGVYMYYVLATEETGIVNEPLMKIGDYADTLSNISISVTAGGDTLSVGTTVQPSEVTVNYKGWHPVQSVHEYDYLLTSNPLCGIGSSKDTLNLATGVCERQVKKLVLTGNEDWTISSAWKKTNTSVFYFGVNDLGGLSENERYIVSTHFASKSRNELYQNDVEGIGKSGSNAVTVRVDDTIATTVNDFKAWLRDNNVTIYYVLTAPTTETITVPTGLSGTEEGYLNQSGTPLPTSPIYPTANEVKVWT